jgi:hypothetical protein
MDGNNGKKLKISLWFVIIMILFIIALVFTFIHISNSSKANTDNYIANQVFEANASGEKTSLVKISKKEERNNLIDLNSLSEINTISTAGQSNTTNTTNTTANTTPSNTTTNTTQQSTENSSVNKTTEQNSQPEKNTYKLNNHTYKFDSAQKVSVSNTASNQYLQLDYNDHIMKVNTDTMYYNNLKKKSDIKGFLEETYKIQITSDIKSGNYKGTNIIICTFTENSNAGYLIIAKLNESETVYFKVFNKADMSQIVSDLSGPLDEISSIIKDSIE